MLATACATGSPAEPPVVERPAGLATTVRSWFGTSLTGPLAKPAGDATPDPAATPIVHCELFLLGSLSGLGPGVTPLAGEIRFVAQPGEPELLRGPSRLALRGSRLVGPDLAALVDLWRHGDGGNACPVADERRPLLRATTCTVAVERSERIEDPDNFLREQPDLGATPKRFGVSIEGPPIERRPDAVADAALVTLDLADLVRPTRREADEDDARARPGLAPRRELVRLATSLTPGGGPLVVVLPSPFSDDAKHGRPAPACALCVELLPAPTDARDLTEHASAVANVRSEARDEAAAAATRAAVHLPQDAVTLALRRAFESLQSDASMRGTVVYVTTATAAPFAGDLALVASDEELAAWLKELADRRAELPPDAGIAAIGWAVERSAWRHVVARMLSGDLPPEVEATVIRHAGAVGRLATSLEEAVEGSSDGASLETRFAAENRGALEDSGAATRVRAFDWLAARGKAPAGFDPLGSAAERRHALAETEAKRE